MRNRYSNRDTILKEGIKFITIFLLCILMGVAVAHPFGYAIMYLDEYEVDRNIYKGEVNVR
jgi:hypothetical protein